MSYLIMRCKECGEENEIKLSDNGNACPDCRTVDELEVVHDEDFQIIVGAI